MRVQRDHHWSQTENADAFERALEEDPLSQFGQAAQQLVDARHEPRKRGGTDGSAGDQAAAFLGRAVAHFDARGIRVRRVLTDNGAGYKRVFEAACHQLGIRWTRTQPYHPWTNGRAERFIRTLQRECVYEGEHFTTDEDRRYAIARWLAFYNSERLHTALGGLSPERWLRAQGVTKV